CCGLFGLFERTGHALGTEHAIAVVRHRPLGDVADRVDVGIGGARVEVDQHAAAHRQPRLAGDLVVGPHPHADHRGVAGHDAAALQQHAGDMAVLAHEAGDAAAELELHAL